MVRKPTEYDECLTYYQWASYQPLVRDYLLKIVNEGKRSIVQGHILKCIGLRPGLPDYFLAIPTEKYSGLWLEMKRRNSKNKKKDCHQDYWIAMLNKSGYYATFAFGADEAIDITKRYIDNKL